MAKEQEGCTQQCSDMCVLIRVWIMRVAISSAMYLNATTTMVTAWTPMDKNSKSATIESKGKIVRN